MRWKGKRCLIVGLLLGALALNARVSAAPSSEDIVACRRALDARFVKAGEFPDAVRQSCPMFLTCTDGYSV